MLDIYVDADGCPVKDEIYRVAARYRLKVVLVANAWMRVPDEEEDVKLVVVTNWDSPVQLRQWLEKGQTADAILRSMDPAPKELTVDVFEEIA